LILGKSVAPSPRSARWKHIGFRRTGKAKETAWKNDIPQQKKKKKNVERRAETRKQKCLAPPKKVEQGKLRKSGASNCPRRKMGGKRIPR